jgi:alginate O-acetyltransferase complex protein AlgJ
VKKFVRKSVLFSLPFILLALVEIFVLPLDFFTFRVWESVKVDTLKDMLPGYFYPRVNMIKTEQGDIAHHTVFAVEKTVEWHTDRFGYRNRDEAKAPEVVIVGDSNTVGAGLTQSQVLSVVLGNRLKTWVYSFAPASLNTFLRDRSLVHDKPRVVVVATIEWDIPLLRPLKPELASPSEFERRFMEFRSTVKESRPLQSIAVPIDRLFKANMLHYYRASMRRAVKSILPQGAAVSPQKPGVPSIRFFLGDLAAQDVPADRFDSTLKVLRSYNDLLRKMGIRFIFLPIPNKENIYHDLIPSKKRSVFLSQLMKSLKEEGIETIDLLSAYDEVYRRKGPVLYPPDDSHWSAEGVRIAAGLLADAIESKKEGAENHKEKH